MGGRSARGGVRTALHYWEPAKFLEAACSGPREIGGRSARGGVRAASLCWERHGRDSAAAGQGARARSRQRAEGATVGCTNGEASQHPGASADQLKWGEVRGSSAYNCNLRLPAIRSPQAQCSGFGELP